MYEEILELTRSSALGGVSEAAMKMARGHLKRLPSPLAYNVTAAKRYYDIGMDVHSPDAYYGMAELLLTQMANASTRRKSKRNANSPSQQELQEEEGQQHQEQQQTLQQVLRYLEEAAMLGHAFAMYNLGMAHSFGYGVNSVDHDVAREWFIQSGLPEGAYLAAHQAKSRGNTALEQALFQKAAKLGFGTPWRKEVRMETGSGGSGGVDLNLPWPMSRMGRVPPQL
jgi:TPR repeat protein